MSSNATNYKLFQLLLQFYAIIFFSSSMKIHSSNYKISSTLECLVDLVFVLMACYVFEMWLADKEMNTYWFSTVQNKANTTGLGNLLSTPRFRPKPAKQFIKHRDSN